LKTLETLIYPPEILAQKGIAKGFPLSGITDDSRRLDRDVLFFAVRGTKSDGHAFVGEALSRGAVPVVDRLDVFEELPVGVLVKSTHRALALGTSRWLGNPTLSLNVVGVTGTNGKTTTTFLLGQIWKAMGLVCGVVGTVECQIGDRRYPATHTTPSAAQLQGWFKEMADEKVSHAALEVTSIALDQERVTGTRFQVGLFTNLTQDHLDYHKDFENYYLAKLKLFREFELPYGIFNVDSDWGIRLKKESSANTKFSFSLLDPLADFFPRSAHFDRKGIHAICATPVGDIEVKSPLIGKHNLANALGTIAVIHALGQDVRRAAVILAESPGAPGRLERVAQGEGRANIFVDYAHTSDALKNVLNSLRELRGEAPGRIITVFGCGGDRDRGKRPLMAKVASELSEVTIATSDNPRTEDPDLIIDQIEDGIDRTHTSYHREVNRRSAICYALSIAGPEDLVLIAGKGHETYQIIGTEQFPFDDRQVIRDYYRIVI